MNDEKQKEYENDDKPYTTCPDCGQPISFENDAGNGYCKDCDIIINIVLINHATFMCCTIIANL